MTPDPMARLLRESVPDGTFGGARTPRTRRTTTAPPPRREVTPAEAAAHYARLAAAVAELDTRPATRRAANTGRHLHAVPDATPTRKAS